MSTRREVEEGLFSLLKDAFPQVHWNLERKGAARSAGLEGSLTCERVEFEWLDKQRKAATVTFSIFIIDAGNQVGADLLSDDIIEYLSENRTLGGLVFDSICNEVLYGQQQGRPDVSAALISFTVTYDV